MSRTAAILRRLVLLFVFALGLFLCGDLTLSDDAFDLLPGEAVRGDLRMLQRMGLVDRLFITVSAAQNDGISAPVSKKSLQESTKKLGDLLVESGRFSYVLSHLPEGYEFALFEGLQPSLPLLFDEGDLQTLAHMTSQEGIQEGLQRSFALLNSPAGIAMKKQVQVDPLNFISLALQKLTLMQSEFAVRIDEGFFMSRDGMSCLLVAESAESLIGSAQAAALESVLHDAFAQALSPGIEAGVIGSLPHTLANSRAIKRDLRVLLPVATVLLVLLLGFALRDIRALAVIGVPYLAAPLAIGLTALVHGKLSGLALGFGIVLLGIAVDISIHLYLALESGHGTRREAMKRVAKPLLFAILTTSSVFLVLLFSQVPSHRQMALLAFFGILLSSACAFLVIPTVAALRQKSVQAGGSPWLRFSTPKRPGPILLGWLILLVLGVMSWPRLHYNGDLQALDVPDKQVKSDERHFRETWGGGGEQAFILATGKSLDAALDGNYRVYRFLREHDVKKFQSFAPLLPGPDAQDRNQQGWRRFWVENRGEFEDRFVSAAVSRGFTETAFAPFFSWLNADPERLSPQKFLGGPLQPLFSSMLKTSPDRVLDDNAYLAMTTVAIDDRILPALLKFGEEEGVHVLANRIWRTEVERLLRHDVITLSCAAGLIITLLVILQFRNAKAVAAVLAPVVSALAAMSIFCFLTGKELNMMHLIMGIMVIGLSVDYGIFIVCAKLSGSETVSSRAVSICAASSLTGFGVLAFAGHPALHALGVTVLVGIGVAWPTAILVSPSLLVFGKKK
jgi:hypothetical protein